MEETNMTKFQKNNYYLVNGDGFKASMYCIDRINHRDKVSATLEFIIMDLKIIEYSFAARSLVNRFSGRKPISIYWNKNEDKDEVVIYSEVVIKAKNKIDRNYKI